MALAVRIGLIAIAAVCVAWFALGIEQSDATAGAQRIIAARHVSAAQARHARALLSDAAVLNPGVGVTELRARLDRARGDLPAARRLAARAARAEPLDAEAWLLYTQLSAGTPQQGPAFRHLVSLVPPVR